ncbi:MAG: CrcB family protein [Opitutales bacterium]|nr:CrcB family protein [Opitutales bacterium]MCH8541216.1 CrcB family protein [Opitutales bacterium]
MTLLVAGGSGLGGLARVSLALAFSFTPPWGYLSATLLANSLGCLVIGSLAAWFACRHGPRGEAWQTFLLPGFCGGFTTVSLFSLQGVALLQDGYYLSLFFYFAGSLVSCLLCVAIGWKLSHRRFSENPES